MLLLWIFLLFMFCVCHAILSVHCSLVVNCLERACLLALLCVMFSFVFVTFPCGVLGQVWFLIVSIPYLSLLPYLGTSKMHLCTQSLRLLSVLMWWFCCGFIVYCCCLFRRSVFGPCFVIQFFVFFLVLQSS